MYEIYRNGALFALTEKPHFIRLHPDGFYYLCNRAEAQGIAVGGTAYALSPGSLGDREAVVVAETDGGRIMQEQEAVNSIVFVTLAETGSIDDVTAGEHISAFAPWVPDVSYTVGQMRQYNSKLYRCITAHTSQADWTPDAAVSLWVAVADPAEEYPAWSQPIGAHDAYDTGDKVNHNGKRWISTVDDNVWEPGVYGWQEVTD